MKKSFTLVEILISVTILSVLFLAMSSVIGSLKISKKTLRNKFDSMKKKELFIKLLYSDIINSDNIKITLSKEKNYVTLQLRTFNSIYGLIHPYVYWYVSKNGNTLVRAEGYEDIKKNDNYYADKFLSGIKKFRIFENKGKYFVYIQARKPIYFEIYKGY